VSSWCRRGRAGTAPPCHGGISWASCKCSSSTSSPLYFSVISWSLLPSWSLLHALLELALHWPCPPWACTG
jgi:hypothetical protein